MRAGKRKKRVEISKKYHWIHWTAVQRFVMGIICIYTVNTRRMNGATINYMYNLNFSACVLETWFCFSSKKDYFFLLFQGLGKSHEWWQQTELGLAEIQKGKYTWHLWEVNSELAVRLDTQASFHSAEILPSHSPTLNHETPRSSNDSFRGRSEMIHIKNQNCSNHIPFIYLDQTRTSTQVRIIWGKILIAFLGWFSSPALLRSRPSSDGPL